MAKSSKTAEEFELLDFHLDRINEAIDQGDYLAAMWWLERNCPEEFGVGGHWVNPRAIIAQNYPNLNLDSEEDVLSTVESWESSAFALQKKWPRRYGYRAWKPEIVHHNI